MARSLVLLPALFGGALAFAPPHGRLLLRPHACSLAAMSEQTELEPSELAKSIVANVFEGDFGARGEAWVAGQAVLIGGVVAGPNVLGLDAASIVLGLLFLSAGLLIAAAGAYELGTSLSPWPTPVSSNTLQTRGVYMLTRHPMYLGFLLDCGGLSLLTRSYERLLCTIVLLLLFSAKAVREEQELATRHGAAYSEWAERTPRFFPSVDGLRKLPEALSGR
mmetsp:Transcript_39006/g.97243  ORF Transcript_39006/g.97243 Transcript_39006/m.97243 type:complete len:221 (-) Transcript_39006:174-836(-)